jgi:acylphosphatase
MERQTCVFSGHVQGVGFRYTVHHVAMQYNVRGYVRNLPDGRVELVMEGEEREMAGVLEEIQQKMNGFIGEVQINRSPATGQYERFSIRH